MTQARLLKSIWAWSVPLLAFVAALIVFGFDLNERLFLWLNQYGRSAPAELFWANATIIGDTLVALSLLSLFAHRRPEIVWTVLLAALFTTLWVHGLKSFIHAGRPLAVFPADLVNVIGIELRRNSFPSGHAATAFTLAGAICLQGVRPALIPIIVLAVAFLVAISRVMVGAHWPLDILAGVFGGWLAAVIGWSVSRKWPTPVTHYYRRILAALLLACSLSLLLVHNTGYPAMPLQIFIGVITTVSAGHFLWRSFYPSR